MVYLDKAGPIEEKKEHYIGAKDEKANVVFVGEGQWQGLIESPAYKRRKEANKVLLKATKSLNKWSDHSPVPGTWLSNF